MLLEGSFGALLKQSIYALVQVLTGHIVVNYAEARNVNCTVISTALHIVGDLGELALLFHDLDRLLPGTALRSSNAPLDVLRQLANQRDGRPLIVFISSGGGFLLDVKDRISAFSAGLELVLYFDIASNFACLRFELGR